MNELYPWQTDSYQKLLLADRQQRLPHGLLLTAKRGSGRQNFVEVWAKRLLCEQQQEFACGECKSCRLFKAGTHPDLHWVAVADDKKQISIDQIRRTTQTSLEKSHLSGWRVIVIYEAEKMTINGYNALLKTLEEPGEKLQLILVTESRSSIPATIISRCQHFMLNNAEPSLVEKWLVNELQDVETADRQLALKLTYGSPLKAKQLLHEQGLDAYYQVVGLLSDVINGKRLSFAVSEQSLCEPLQLLHWWEFIVSEIILHHYQKPRLSHQQGASLAELAESTDVRLLFTLRNDILFQIKQLTEGVSLNIAMQIDHLGDKWSKCRV